ncbi:tetratricopeptide repeat protein [Amycolatopsis sp. WAC 04169]|uniref:tetratricopeptide repeat protein n=1 Tax=Amycolatopsis sp. WAC 04169 TaxID=2203197 RepID=UPI000F77586C|nr:tetratricopeptide repeat protein [Amycolatopsis sp. WAC 04169]
MERVPVPPGLVNIPAGSKFFVGRLSELDQLDAALCTSVRTAVAAIHGLGGVGKTALAVHFAHLHRDRFELVWWMNADSRAALESGLADLAAVLAPETVALPPDQRSELGLRWLAAHKSWLVILDNLTALDDAAILLDRIQAGTVVITSRQSSGWRGLGTVHLKVLAEDDAEALLSHLVRTHWADATLTGARQLCEELGWLPLAIEQASAYLAQSRITPAVYLDLLTKYPAQMFAATSEGSDERRAVARVWHLTLDKLSDTPLAGKLLRQFAWYASSGIPRQLLGSGASEPDQHRALGRLAAYSMISLDATSITVHRLVQAVSRTPDPEDRHRQAVDIEQAHHDAVTALTAAVRDADYYLPTNWPAFTMVLPHAWALFDRTADTSDTEQICALADRLGHFLDEHGDNTRAVTLFTRAVAGRLRLLGADHPDTLSAQDHLGHAYLSAGDLKHAIPLLEANLDARIRILEYKDPDILTSRQNLANAYAEAGDLPRAIRLAKVNLDAAKEVLDPDDPEILITLSSLAYLYMLMRNYEGAIRLYEEVLQRAERKLDVDHPDLLTYRSNLAGAHASARHYRRALSLNLEVLAARQRILSPKHPATLVSKDNLAQVYLSLGKHDLAISMSLEVAADREENLGADHPDTLMSRNNVAGAYEKAGDVERALRFFRETLNDADRVLGPRHRVTAVIRSNLRRVAARHS